MSVIPLIKTQSVVTNLNEFVGFTGPAVLITPFDETQLCDDHCPNLCYDLRVGESYRDHRRKETYSLSKGGKITLQPGAAVIIRTEESVYLPQSMFGYIVPKVSMLKRGLSNTVSKVDAGYRARLSVTLFNLGKRKVTVSREEKFCSLVIHRVEDGAILYNQGEKDIGLETGPSLWRRFLDELEGYEVLAKFLIVVTYSGAAVWAFVKVILHFWKIYHHQQ
jgi:dCTP deaminase